MKIQGGQIRENERHGKKERKKGGERERERERDKVAQTRTEGGREGEREANKYLERRRIICAVVEATSLGCGSTPMSGCWLKQ